jgi:hypothetical protein
MANPSDAAPDAPFASAPRPLAEDVLQSAEEAVLDNPVSVGTLQARAPGPAPDHPAPRRSPNTDRLARIVGEKPLQSALAALLAGALLTSLVKLALSRRRH